MPDHGDTPHVVFRVDASARIGAGHLSRCLTLARALASEGARVSVASRAPTDHARAWIAREGHALLAIAEDEDEIAASLERARDADLAVVDGYGFGPELLGALRAPGRVLAAFDDLGDRPLPVDAVLNGNLYGDAIDYAALAPGALLLVGAQHALVREEFTAARRLRETRPRPTLPHLLVTMGGADPTSETEKALAALDLLARRSIPLTATVVVGGSNPRAEALRAAAARLGPDVAVVVDVTDMGARMAASDLALTAAGSTCLELACVGVAALAVVVADNQRGVAEAVARLGLGRVLGESPAVTAEAMAGAIADLLADPAARAAMEREQRARVDGQGAPRVAAALTRLVRAART